MVFKFILVIIILIFLFILNIYSPRESFNLRTDNHIWLYWENKNGYKRSGYIDLCYRTIKKHCSHMNVHFLDEKSVFTYLPNLDLDLLKWCSIPQKAD